MTNLDLHDIARAAKTYGVRSFHVVMPLADQKSLIDKILNHWISGAGGRYNPLRREAMEMIQTKNSVADVLDHIRNEGAGVPKTVATSARKQARSIRISAFRDMLRSGEPYLLNFGTAWGLADDFIAHSDYLLNPIRGNSDYNHLSVRSAAAIMLDRLMGMKGEG